MTLELYQPDDQVERLKAWWKSYGNSLIAGVVIGLLLLGGGNYWRQHKATRAAEASATYDAILAAYQHKRLDEARAATTRLKNDYAATPYAGKAVLIMARADFDAGDAAAARVNLQWAVDNATEAATRHAARLRLGRLLLEQGEIDAGLALITVKEFGGFDSGYQELKGDLMLAKGERAQARSAYREALARLPDGSAYAQVLQMKLDDLGPEDAQ